MDIVHFHVDSKASGTSHELQVGKPQTSSLGIIIVSTSAFLFATMGLFVCMASKKFPSSQIMWVRCLIQLVVATCLSISARVNPFGPADLSLRKLCVFRGMLGCLCNWVLYYGISRLPLADTSTLYFTQPFFTAILSPLFLGEASTSIELVCCVLGFGGVIFVVRPTFLFGHHSSDSAASPVNNLSSGDLAFAYCTVLLGAVLSGSMPVLVRKIGSAVHHYTLVFYFALLGFILSTFCIAFGFPQDGPAVTWPPLFHNGHITVEYIYLLGCSLAGTVAQIFYNKGMQLERAQTVVLLRQLDVVFSFIYQSLVFGNGAVSPWSILGAAFVISSSAVLLLSRGNGCNVWKALQKKHTDAVLFSNTCGDDVETTSEEYAEGGGFHNERQPETIWTFAERASSYFKSGFTGLNIHTHVYKCTLSWNNKKLTKVGKLGFEAEACSQCPTRFRVLINEQPPASTPQKFEADTQVSTYDLGLEHTKSRSESEILLFPKI
uniref:EamA domain-containing protein n=1 Tax=Fibrocapsa japonica TaxID=94617 RepID=A0A7S2V0W2_9STRA